MEPDSYEVTDPEEKKLLLGALEGEKSNNVRFRN